MRNPAGGYRLFYTAVGPDKPFPVCQGYLLSAVSDDGLSFRTEPGIRVAPQPALPHACLRVLAPSVTTLAGGGWRMYFEARGPANRPTVICSAVSGDMLNWAWEDGIRLQSARGVRSPRFLALPDGGGRVYCCGSECGSEESGERGPVGVLSAVTSDGVNFAFERGLRFRAPGTEREGSISAAEVVAPKGPSISWAMFYSAWQGVPFGTVVPVHPSSDPNAVANGQSANFAAASIATDMAGYRSRIFLSRSADGLAWERGACVIEGAGHDGAGLDAVHAEDMSVIAIGAGEYRMYYACCDAQGNWRIASAVTVVPE